MPHLAVPRIARPLFVALLALLAAAPAAAAEPAAPEGTPGFLVLAPDRGFQGNEEARDAFAPLAAEHPAALVFVTDERTRGSLVDALAALRGAGAERIVALPFFVVPSHPRLALARALLDELAPGAAWGTPYGESYLAVEALADRLRAAAPPAGAPVVVVATGAADEASRRAMTGDLQRLADLAARGFGLGAVTALVAPSGMEDLPELDAAFEADLAAAVDAATVVVPFHQGAELDGMMSETAWLRYRLPDGATLAGHDVTPDPLVSLWLRREAARRLPIDPARLGVVALAHGADFHWNEAMRKALAPLSDRYLVEPSFSMADRDLVERAVRRLEERGAQAVVIVRIFGMEESFRGSVERMAGLDVERAFAAAAAAREHAPGHAHAHQAAAAPAASHGHGHGHGAAAGHPEPRIRTALPIATAGGLEDHPLFARALLDQARALSEAPGEEVVLITAHGLGDDAHNEHWQRILASLAAQMREAGGDRFAAIETVTWREDWPDKRQGPVERARRIVEDARAAGRRVLVLPARTNAQGPERELLAGLDFTLGEGFASHPLFAAWVEEQIVRAAGELPIAGGTGTLVAALRGGR